MISVIIPTLNAEGSINRLLNSLRSQTVSSEIIVIDSLSSDNTVKIADSYGVKTIRIRREDFDYLWLLNNDTIVKSDALTHMVIKMKTNAEVCGSTLLYYDKPHPYTSKKRRNLQ